MKEVLSRFRGGGAIDDIADELNMNKSTLQAMIEFMVRAGHLYEIGSGKGHGNGCRGCPVSKTYSVPVPERKKVKMYVLTEEGMEHLIREELNEK